MPGYPTSCASANQKLSQLPKQQSLYYAGGNVGLGFPLKSCFFSVFRNDVEERWSIAKTIRHFLEFSNAAKARIVADCLSQQRYIAEASEKERMAFAQTVRTMTGGYHA